MTRRIDGILFDLGETLADFGRVDLEKLFLRGTRAVYSYLCEIGQPVPPFPEYHHMQHRAVRLSVLKSRLTRSEFNALDVITDMARKLSQQLTPEQTEELGWLWYQPLSLCATVEAGTVEMLQQFTTDGLKLGVVSNTFVPGVALDRHLARENLLELLPVRVYSCDMGFRKPRKKIFQTALDRTGLSAENTLFVGDSFLADIWGANRMKMISVLKSPRPRRFIPVRPAYTVSSLLELPDVLDRCRNA